MPIFRPCDFVRAINRRKVTESFLNLQDTTRDICVMSCRSEQTRGQLAIKKKRNTAQYYIAHCSMELKAMSSEMDADIRVLGCDGGCVRPGDPPAYAGCLNCGRGSRCTGTYASCMQMNLICARCTLSWMGPRQAPSRSAGPSARW